MRSSRGSGSFTIQIIPATCPGLGIIDGFSKIYGYDLYLFEPLLENNLRTISLGAGPYNYQQSIAQRNVKFNFTSSRYFVRKGKEQHTSGPVAQNPFTLPLKSDFIVRLI